MRTTLILGLSALGIVLANGCATPTTAPKPVIGLFAVESLYILPADEVPLAQLDHVPKITPTRPMAFPAELRWRGFVGHLTGFVGLLADGTVKQLTVTGGNSELLHQPADAYVAGLKFETPVRNGQPVPSSFAFEFFVTEDWTYGPFVLGESRQPNQGTAPASVTLHPANLDGTPVSLPSERHPATPEDLRRWNERLAQVHVGMRREEVERVLMTDAAGRPRAGRDYEEATITGGTQGVRYPVASDYSIIVFYDYTGTDSANEAHALRSPENRVIEAPRLERQAPSENGGGG